MDALESCIKSIKYNFLALKNFFVLSISRMAWEFQIEIFRSEEF